MSIKEFTEEIKVVLESTIGKEVKINEVMKNNGVVLHGLSIIEPGINVTPTIYMESFFNNFENGGKLEEIAERIWEIYKRDRITHYFDMNWFKDFEHVRERVAYKLVNAEANKELLEKVPYEKILDLAKVYYVTVNTEEFGNGTILIYNTHLELWGITAEQLREIAEENTPKLFPVVVDTMSNILMEMLDMGELNCEESDAFPDMYIMSNATRVFGAAALCYTDAIRDFANKMDSDIIILPSSLHELIMIPMKEDADMEAFKNMVYEVNRTQVANEEVLSDSIYIYRRKENHLEIA